MEQRLRLKLGELADTYGMLVEQGLLPAAWCAHDLDVLARVRTGEPHSGLRTRLAWRYNAARLATRRQRERALAAIPRALRDLLARWAEPAEILAAAERINQAEDFALTDAELRALVEDEVATFNRRNRAGQRRVRA